MEGMEATTPTLENYRYKFGITRPVPITRHGELRLTIQPEEVYIHLLRRLAQPPEPTYVQCIPSGCLFGDADRAWLPHSDRGDVMGDHENLMQLIFNHYAFLERFWRRLLSDIRTGSVDEHIPISAERRDALEVRQPATSNVAVTTG